MIYIARVVTLIETQLIHFYKNRLSNFSLVFKRLTINIVITFLAVTISTRFFLSCIVKESFGFALIFYILSVTVGAALTYILFIRPYNILTINEYNIKFRSTQWEAFRMLLLKNFLFSSNLLNEEYRNNKENTEQHIKKLESLIDLLQNRLDNNKKENLLAALGSNINTAVIFFIPVWTAFNSQIFMHNTLTIEQGLKRLLLILAILLPSIWFFFMIRNAIKDFNFFSTDRYITDLIDLLNQLKVILILDNPNYLKKYYSEELNDLIENQIKDYESTLQTKTKFSFKNIPWKKRYYFPYIQRKLDSY
ncbi:hypothetical protein COL30_00065 [Bacillus pseudomycoides]|nr:hypothetical protein COO19_07680 [Bacillus pseudomycoides]PEI94517.1 hypothetical protein CN686_15395 [Bacillus pseudomycoides]PEK13205.1 hypothetical protein CN693_24855 [Bacillus pseudomycoides]PEM75695.1 hypothetical protein CN619_09465 [Bacillus pseudomycoides]PEO15077.1 hypothetical protein CN542_17990 [Bacillus pseudomycoides]